MKVCVYKVPYDGGSAPNPFWGYCTLAFCVPNHKELNLKKGDWIVGLLDKSRGSKLLYAMEISEKMDFDKYFNDPRFERKKYKKGNWKEERGDNIYRKNSKGELEPCPNSDDHPRNKDQQDKDMKHPNHVFISKKEEFYYFGDNAKDTPKIFEDTRGKDGNIPRLKYHHQPEIDKFISWLKNNHKPGIHGDPND